MEDNNIPKEENKETPEVTAEPKVEAQEEAKEEVKEDPKIKFDDFTKVDLRVAKVLEVQEHPNADKLLLVKVDLGDKAQRDVKANPMVVTGCLQ